jgi:hypothetical protein
VAILVVTAASLLFTSCGPEGLLARFRPDPEAAAPAAPSDEAAPTDEAAPPDDPTPPAAPTDEAAAPAAPPDDPTPPDAPPDDPTPGDSDPSVDPSVAILHDGPTRGRGIGFLPPNIIEYQRAEYEIAEGLVALWYVPFETPLWEIASTFRCDGEVIGRVETIEGNVHVQQSDGVALFMRFPEELSDVCAFIRPFLRDLRFFQRANRDDPLVPFPAFVSLDR